MGRNKAAKAIVMTAAWRKEMLKATWRKSVWRELEVSGPIERKFSRSSPWPSGWWSTRPDLPTSVSRPPWPWGCPPGAPPPKPSSLKNYDTLPHASPADGPCSLCSPRWNWSSWRAGPQHSFSRSPCWQMRAISLKLSPYHDTSGEEHSLIWLATIDPGDDLLWFYNHFVHSQKHPAKKTAASRLLDLLLLWVLLYFFIMPKDLLRLKSIFCEYNFSLYQNGVQLFSDTQTFKLVFFAHIYMNSLWNLLLPVT